MSKADNIIEMVEAKSKGGLTLKVRFDDSVSIGFLDDLKSKYGCTVSMYHDSSKSSHVFVVKHKSMGKEAQDKLIKMIKDQPGAGVLISS